MVEGRLSPGLDRIGGRTEEAREATPEFLASTGVAWAMKERFLADTATFSSAMGLRAALEFFGAGRLLFASDMPFSCGGGPASLRESLAAVEALELSEADREAVLWGNAERLFGWG